MVCRPTQLIRRYTLQHRSGTDAGRRSATYRGDDDKAMEVFYHHAPGVRGPGVAGGGGVIMRERSFDLIADPSEWATKPGDWQGHQAFYATDFAGHGGSVIALIGAEGLIEQYRYSSSGVPIGLPLGDLDGNGTVDTTDGDICKDAYPIYAVRADLNLDGVVDDDDFDIITANDGNTLGRGVFSVASVRNIKGYNGCEVFGEGLHTLWNCGMEVDSGLGVGLREASRGKSEIYTLAGGTTRNGKCTTTCGVTGCFTGCTQEMSTQGIWLTGRSIGVITDVCDPRNNCRNNELNCTTVCEGTRTFPVEENCERLTHNQEDCFNCCDRNRSRLSTWSLQILACDICQCWGHPDYLGCVSSAIDVYREGERLFDETAGICLFPCLQKPFRPAPVQPVRPARPEVGAIFVRGGVSHFIGH